MPSLASHWKVDDDKQTFWFRIDPRARFADGVPITTEDVIATYDLLVDPRILSPYTNTFYEKYDPPEAISPYIFKVRSTENNWKDFHYFGGTSILPAHIIDLLDGDEYLENFNYRIPVGSGPYEIHEENINPQRYITLTRRNDWWRAQNIQYQHQYNFDSITFKTILDPAMQIQEFLAGNIDVYMINRAQWWHEKFNGKLFERGLTQKRKIFTDEPQGLQGWAFNTRKAPFSDPLVREAFTLLIPRQELIDNMMYSEYIISDSYFPNSPYEHPNNQKYRYNFQRATELLREAGYTERNMEGVLVHNVRGEPFEIELPLVRGSEHIMQPLQEELKKAGIRMNIRRVDFAQRVKLGYERKFDLLYVAYSGSVFPNPYGQLHSSMTDQINTNNLTGFKNERADELIEQELTTFDQQERVKLLQELDSIFMAENHYALAWYAPFTRFAYWNKFGQPSFYLGKIEDYRGIFRLWWYDSEKAAIVEEGINDPSVTMPLGPVEIRFWEKYKASQNNRY